MTSSNGSSVSLNMQGELLLMQPLIHGQHGEWYFPLGDNQWRIAAQTPAGISLLTFIGQKTVDQIVLPGEQADLMLLSPDGTLLYTSAGRLLRVWQIAPQGAQTRETQTLTQQPRSLQLLAGAAY